MSYIFSFDLSLSNSGVAVFDEKGNPIKILSVPTTSKQEHKDRLKTIADALLQLRKEYETHLIILESGFSRHAASTQAIFKVVGLVSYLFSDCSQITFAPSSIKKIVSGSGKSDKEVVQNKILEKFPHLKFSNQDESDAVGVGVAYFVTNNLMKL
jgi:crossover junction endodeoxyribonuclease RuvC